MELLRSGNVGWVPSFNLILDGEVMKKRLVLGVGLYEFGTYSAKVNGSHTHEYRLWTNMLRRCYSKKFQDEQPTYKGCKVSENFLNFQFFATWCQSQVGFGVKGFHLDKDLLSDSGKIYSEGTCVFIPRQVNSLLVKQDSCRGVYPIGVSLAKQRGTYEVSISKFGVNVHLGKYKTPEEAFLVYKTAKEAHIKGVAEIYKNQIDSRAYQALIQLMV